MKCLAFFAFVVIGALVGGSVTCEAPSLAEAEVEYTPPVAEIVPAPDCPGNT